MKSESIYTIATRFFCSFVLFSFVARGMKTFFLANSYFATGEGMTIFLYSIICENEENAKLHFHEDMKIDGYFHIGTKVYDDFDEFANAYLKYYLSKNTINLLKKDPSRFFFHYHINLS